MIVASTEELTALPDNSIIGWDNTVTFATKTPHGWVLVNAYSGEMAEPARTVDLPASVLWTPQGYYMSQGDITRVTAGLAALAAVLALFVSHAREMVLEFGMGAPTYVESDDVLETVTATLARYGLKIGDLGVIGN